MKRGHGGGISKNNCSKLGHATGFAPVYDENSKLLILGSFPSVLSREVCFYYGNKRNRFWQTVCSFFGEEIPETVEGKRDFLLRRGIALWDVICECDIDGSADSSIINERVADVPSLLKNGKIKRIACNGVKAYSLLLERFPELKNTAVLLPSTSPANPRFSAEAWTNFLQETFGGNA